MHFSFWISFKEYSILFIMTSRWEATICTNTEAQVRLWNMDTPTFEIQLDEGVHANQLTLDFKVLESTIRCIKSHKADTLVTVSTSHKEMKKKHWRKTIIIIGF